MKKSIPGHTNISLLTKYQIIQAVMKTPIVPEIKSLWSSVFYRMTNESFRLISWCEFKKNNEPVHHLRIENDTGRHYANGLLSRIVYIIAAYRHEHENLDFIVNWKTSGIAHPNRFYNKLNRDVKSVESGCSLTFLGQKTSTTNLLSTTVDGYRIATREDTSNVTGKATYSLTIFGRAVQKRIVVHGKNSEKIFMLLQKKQQRVR